MALSILLIVFCIISVKAQRVVSSSDPLTRLSQQFANFQLQLDSMQAQLTALQTSVNQKMSSDDSTCSLRDITEAIRNHKFKLAEEKLLHLTDKSKVSNIVHDVYADSAVNADVILNFAKSLSDSDFQFRFFDALRDELRSSGVSDPFKVIAVVEALERQATRQKNASPEMKQKVQSLIDGAVEDIKVMSAGILKTAMISDKYQKKAEIENLASAIFNFRSDVSNEVMERVVDSVFGVVAADKILDNIGSHKDIPQVITGLTATFNRFNYAGNLNHGATLALASNLKALQLREKYIGISPALKDEVDKVIQQLPICAKNLYFHRYICFWNRGRGEYLYAAASPISFDPERRSIFTWYPGDIPTGAYWSMEKIGGSYYFKNRDHSDEYIYSALNDHSKDMRYVFNWVAGNNTDDQSAWSIELDGDYCYIKSSRFNEHLFASAIRYDQLNSYVLSWKPTTTARSAEFQWQIRNCG